VDPYIITNGVQLLLPFMSNIFSKFKKYKKCHKNIQHLAVNNNNNNRSFNMVKTHAQPYKHIIHEIQRTACLAGQQ